MLSRILYINLFLFFFSMNNYGQYKDVIQDTLIIQKQDSIKKNNIFRRIYKYFQEANKPKEEKNSILVLSEVLILPVIPN